MPKRHSYTLQYKLEAVKYAEENSGTKAAKKFEVDRKQIREWISKKAEMEKLLNGKPMTDLVTKAKRKKLEGSGRKPFYEELEEQLFNWIIEQRSNQLRVSRKLIQVKAIEFKVDEFEKPVDPNFKASKGWLRRFLKRYGLSLRKKTTIAQKNPDQMYEKLASYICYVSQLKKKYKIKNSDMICMDETALWFDMVSNTTIAPTGSTTVSLKGTGNEKLHFTVVLCAKGDGTRLKPYVVFKKSKREVAALQKVENNNYVATSDNGWMNDVLTADWLDKVIGVFGFTPRLLAWDSYRCHISEETKRHLKKFNLKMAVIPGGCTKYIQAPDVSWNKIFKEKVREEYDQWMATDGNKEFTKGGNIKAASKQTVLNWVTKAWNSVSKETIIKSFKICALTTMDNGEEDDQIQCLKEGQPCREGWEVLVKYRDEQSKNDREITLDIQEDEEEVENNEILIDGDESVDTDDELSDE